MKTISKKATTEFEANITTRNSFEAISEQKKEDPENHADNNVEKKREKIPPIILNATVTDFIEFREALLEDCKDGATIKHLQTQTKIYTNTREDYQLILDRLAEGSTEFYTFTPAWEKKKQLVLKGLPNVYTEEEIINELKIKNIECTKVIIIKKKDAQATAVPVRLLTFEASTNIGDVKKVRALQHTRISWENYINKRGVTQCFKCQGFGHGAKHYHLQPKCVKCGKDHLTQECKKDMKTKPKCCNCGDEHPASFVGSANNPDFTRREHRRRQHEQTSISRNFGVRPVHVGPGTTARPKHQPQTTLAK